QRNIFFFQAEDGIRDSSVTGVQTCALPIYRIHARRTPSRQETCDQRDDCQDQKGRTEGHRVARAHFVKQIAKQARQRERRRRTRSEERRVGKECRGRGAEDESTKREGGRKR